MKVLYLQAMYLQHSVLRFISILINLKKKTKNKNKNLGFENIREKY